MPRKKCPSGTRLNKKTNRCNKIKKTLKKRCPNGTRKNKKTGHCDKLVVSSNYCENDLCSEYAIHGKKYCAECLQEFGVSPPKKRSRCPKGTRKNKKTGNCDKIITEQIDAILTQSVIQIEKSADIKTLSKQIIEKIKGLEEKKKKKFIVMAKQKFATPTNFSPNVNKELQILNSKTPDKLIALGCYNKVSKSQLKRIEKMSFSALVKELEKLQYIDLRYPNLYETISSGSLHDAKAKMVFMLSNPPAVDKIRITDAADNNKCVNWDDKQLRVSMMKNLNSKKNIDFSKIIGPKQYLSNCWFNTALMCLFISDKGRKFTRLLRHNMINSNIRTGNLWGGSDPSHDEVTQLKKAFVVYNTLIDNCLRGVMDKSINSNFAISSLNSVLDLYGVRDSGNPITFFEGIKEYLQESPRDDDYDGKNIFYDRTGPISKTEDLKKEFGSFGSCIEYDEIPDCIIIEMYSENGGITSSDKQKYIKEEITFPNDNGNITYKLDSAILRSTCKVHFTSYITGNGVEYRYEGHSHSGLKPFKWKSLINKDQDFDFSDDETPGRWDDMKFNFMNGYNILFYYRTTP